MTMRVGLRIKLDDAEMKRIDSALKSVSGRTTRGLVTLAANATAKKAMVILSKRAAEVYESPRSKEIKDRASIQKGRVNNFGAEILFRSDLPGITKFKYRPKATPTMFSKSGKKRVIPLLVKDAGGKRLIFRTLGKQKRYSVSVSQLKKTKMQRIRNSFIQTLNNATGNSHEFLGYRKGKERNPLRQVMGSSDKAMVGNEKVYGVEEEHINAIFLEECEARLSKALASAGGK